MIDPRSEGPDPYHRGRGLRLAAAGLAVVLLAFAAVVLWPVLNGFRTPSTATQPTVSPARPATIVPADDGLVLWPGFDDRYYVTAQVNGVAILFRIAPHAERTLIDPRDARRAGLATDEVYRYRDVLLTSGPVAEATVARMEFGHATFENVPVLLRADALGVSTLGRDVLDRFSDWGRRRTGGGPVAFVLEY